MAKKVITVDDSATVRLALKGPLLEDGYEVIEANDGTDAVNKLKDIDVDLMINLGYSDSTPLCFLSAISGLQHLTLLT